jgi:endonuclease/exonuclease/phosphatase family metal-dependent hydrolase
MRNRLRLRLQQVFILEAALVGLFFISATRFLIGMIYSRAGGASIVLSLDPTTIAAGTPGAIDANTVTNEIMFLVYMLALPLLALILGRIRWVTIVAVGLIAAGRALMIANTSISPLIATGMVFGGGLVYLAMLVRFRAQAIPYLFVLGIAADQVFRAVGNTLDPSWSPDYLNIQLALSGILILMSVITTIGQGRQQKAEQSEVLPNYGLMPIWGGIGLGGLLFLELALLALPNTIAGRADYDYTTLAPFVTLATLLPLIPWVRQQASNFVGLFDQNARGWLWMLLMALMIVFGTRFQGIAAGVALVLAQFAASLLWWWVVRPRGEKERQFTGLWLVLGVLVFVMLTAADNFTYDYGYVQNMPTDLAFLNPYVPPFLRAFRGFGLGVILLSVFLAALPMVQTRRRIPWTGGTRLASFFGLLVAVGVSVGVASAVRPPVIQGVRDTPQNPLNSIRIGTYNIHAGFNEFFHFDLDAIARTIQQSGADVVLIQQAEIGRLTSFGVDEVLWLARRLGMGARFFPTNEGLQGLAVLSRVEIVNDEGVLLSSSGSQTGVQRVQIRPDEGVITLYNTRLEYLLEAADNRSVEDQQQDQQRQLNEIFGLLNTSYANDKLGRLLVGGTFNNIPDSPIGDQMRNAGFLDPFAGTGLPAELSATLWRTGYPKVQFDYLWLWRRSLVPIGANTVNTNASDHRMAVIETFIKGAQ